MSIKGNIIKITCYECPARAVSLVELDGEVRRVCSRHKAEYIANGWHIRKGIGKWYKEGEIK